MKAKRKPDWTLAVKESPSSPWRNLGAGWQTEKGNVYLKLDDGVTLRGSAMLFPYRERPTGYQPRPSTPVTAKKPSFGGDYMDRKRVERENRPQPVNHEDDTMDLNVEPPNEPPWL